ncbi:MAG: cell division protein FtsL [Nitrospirales bacterium]|nr:cell division protein FtsL [Nitrospirales bacterium]
MKKPVVLIMGVLLGAWCLIYVGINVDMWRLGYELEDLEAQRSVLKRQQESLQVQISKLMDPQRIAHQAEQQLGFTTPKDGQVVMVSLDALPSIETGSADPVRLVQNFLGNQSEVP